MWEAKRSQIWTEYLDTDYAHRMEYLKKKHSFEDSSLQQNQNLERATLEKVCSLALLTNKETRQEQENSFL